MAQKIISKAEQKRQKDTRDQLERQVGLKLKEFENRYMNAYTEWNIAQIQQIANRVPQENREDFYKLVVGKTRKETNIPKGYGKPSERYVGNVTQDDAYYVWVRSHNARQRLKLDALLRFEFMTEAAQGYQVKFQRLIDKMMAEHFNSRKMKIERVYNAGRELEILISDDSTRVFHARAIWVDGAIKAPHYRFITTTRNEK